MEKIIKTEKGEGGIESKVIEEYTPLITNVSESQSQNVFILGRSLLC